MKKLTESEQGEYAALTARAENGELKPIGSPVHGEDAATAARGLLFEATGTSNLKEITQVALGRPRLGKKVGPRPRRGRFARRRHWTRVYVQDRSNEV